ncbi:MAG: LLM class flavin-dependent oxidoreductase [Chloroflexi bacterium]|nr:LLM class flavin-dependent oxidoreductase [Chloroflexota bacterium]
MRFGAFFVGQRPQLHEQYADEHKVNPNPVSRTDVEVYEDILKGAELAEELGFDSVWIAEHAFSEHSIISAPHSLLAAIAARTKRVKIGVACSIVPWHAPLRLAQDLATIDIISGGRLVVGVGRGYQKREFDVYGIDIAESRDRFIEGMDITIKAWTEERFAYDGKFFSFPEVMVIPKPVQKPTPPIMMAVTHSPESVEIAVSNRWGLFTVGSSFFPASPDSDQNLISLYRRRMIEEGVAPDDIEIAAVRNVYVSPTDQEAIDLLTPRLQWAGDMGEYLRRPVSEMAAAPGGLKGYENYVRDPFIEKDLLAERAKEGMAAIGSPEKVTRAIKELENNHVTNFISYLDAGGLDFGQVSSSLRLFAEKVIPNFR